MKIKKLDSYQETLVLSNTKRQILKLMMCMNSLNLC